MCVCVWEEKQKNKIKKKSNYDKVEALLLVWHSSHTQTWTYQGTYYQWLRHLQNLFNLSKKKNRQQKALARMFQCTYRARIVAWKYFESKIMYWTDRHSKMIFLLNNNNNMSREPLPLFLSLFLYRLLRFINIFFNANLIYISSISIKSTSISKSISKYAHQPRQLHRFSKEIKYTVFAIANII